MRWRNDVRIFLVSDCVVMVATCDEARGRRLRPLLYNAKENCGWQQIEVAASRIIRNAACRIFEQWKFAIVVGVSARRVLAERYNYISVNNGSHEVRAAMSSQKNRKSLFRYLSEIEISL